MREVIPYTRMKDKEKIRIYEELFHKINAACISCKHDLISKYIARIDNWSYAHRRGNGQYSAKEQQELVDRATRKLIEPIND